MRELYQTPARSDSCAVCQQREVARPHGGMKATGGYVREHMRLRSKRIVAGYAVVTLLIAASFAWQMLHGICPVP
jgi:hypothetical protein